LGGGRGCGEAGAWAVGSVVVGGTETSKEGEEKKNKQETTHLEIEDRVCVCERERERNFYEKQRDDIGQFNASVIQIYHL
jgi:hypothetical protein